MLVCKKIRIKISQEDKVTLEFMQRKCRGLYNWWIGKLRKGEKWHLYEAKLSLQESKKYDPELNDVYGKLLAEVYFRIDSAMKAFFRRLKENAGKAGFPRYKSRYEFFTLSYPAMYIKTNGKTVILPTGGKGKNKSYQSIIAKLTEQPPEKFKELAISKDSRGNYYCSFVYERPEKPRNNSGVVAFDLGIKTLAVGVNESGRIYKIGGFKGYRWYNRQLDKIRSKRDKCKKGTRRYRFLTQVYKRVSEKKHNKQKDSLHKASYLIAYKLAESAVVIGDLSQEQMVAKSENKNKNRAVKNDWGLYQFKQFLSYKCKLYGKELHVISERNTSKTCHKCGYIQAMPLYKRTYKCPKCGLVMDRDENSAINILNRFFARLGPYTT